jgi:hypothetical protein
MGPKGRPDTKTNWSTDCRLQDELQLQGGALTPRLTGRLTVGRNATSTSCGGGLEYLHRGPCES